MDGGVSGSVLATGDVSHNSFRAVRRVRLLCYPTQ